MQSKIMAIAMLLLCAGCMIWDAGYTDNVDVVKAEVSAYNKVPITYSLNVTSSNGNAGELAKIYNIRAKIEDAMRSAGLFSEVTYGNIEGEDSYHVHFTVRFCPTPPEKMGGHIFLSEFSLLLIPNGDVEGLDITATLYLKGKPIYATAKPEEIRYLIWLPLAPVGLFMNSWTVGGACIEGSIHSCINDIVREHCKLFLSQ